MDENLQYVAIQLLERTHAALEKNNMEAHILDKKEDVLPMVQKILRSGKTVANGGSVTLSECGVLEHLRSGEYNFLDREAPDADIAKLYRDTFNADYYLASANAITTKGEIYEVDGRGNRVAAIAFGPETVILIVGRNKIVPNMDAAFERRRNIAGPANCRRVGARTPCATTGVCINCVSPGRICCTEIILRQQLVKGRIKVLLVNEDLGY